MRHARLMSVQVLILVICALLCSCDALFGYANGDAQEGKVVDAGTGAPIPGAYVVANWVGNGYESTICFHVAVAKTGDNGEFIIPAWREKSEFGSIEAEYVGIYVYINGYSLAYMTDGAEVIRLRKMDDTLSPDKRLAMISEAARKAACHSAGESEKNLADFYRSLYGDAMRLAEGQENSEVLYLKYLINNLEIGSTLAGVKYDEEHREVNNGDEGGALSPVIIDKTDAATGNSGNIRESN